MPKKEQVKESSLYKVGQEIYYSGVRGGITTSVITKVGRKYCELSNNRLRLNIELNRVVSNDASWTSQVWESLEAYELEKFSNKLWDEIRLYFSRAYSKPKEMTDHKLQQIKSIIDEVQ